MYAIEEAWDQVHYVHLAHVCSMSRHRGPRHSWAYPSSESEGEAGGEDAACPCGWDSDDDEEALEGGYAAAPSSFQQEEAAWEFVEVLVLLFLDSSLSAQTLCVLLLGAPRRDGRESRGIRLEAWPADWALFAARESLPWYRRIGRERIRFDCAWS